MKGAVRDVVDFACDFLGQVGAVDLVSGGREWRESIGFVEFLTLMADPERGVEAVIHLAEAKSGQHCYRGPAL